MNIAIVCYPTFGGSGVVATELGLSLAKRGHQVHFITYSQPVRLGLWENNIHYHEVYVEEYPLFRYQPYELALSTKMVEVVRKYSIEVIHAHYAIPHAYAAYMAKAILSKEGIKVAIITTLHGTDITLVGSHPYYKTAVEFSINESDAVTSVSDSLRQDTLRFFDIRKAIKVIPNFIELEKPSAPKRCKRSLIAPPEEKVITHISNFRKVKRIDDVVHIFYQIQQRLPSKLLMVGDGPEREPAQALCEQLGIAQQVKFVGNSNDINDLLCFSDLFLLPSETESFGLAALEAMVNGVPVVSSNAGGLPEVNAHGLSGYLAPVGDVAQMSSLALQILQDEPTLKAFKLGAKEQAARFNQKEIIPLYEALYQEAVGGL